MNNSNNNALFTAGPPMTLNSYVRVLHASPDAPPVDVYANGNLVAKNLAFAKFTDYLPVPPGNYNIEVYPTGQKNTPVISTNISIPSNYSFTAAAVGMLADIALFPIPEAFMPAVNGQKSYVRFVHLSPNAPAVDITLPNGTKLFENVSYKQYTSYIKVNPGNYTLQVKPAGSEQVVLTVPNVELMPGKIYSVYAVGLVGQEPPLQALLANDNTY